MKPEEINRAIAESVGWKFIPCHDDGFGRATGERWLDPDGDIGLVPPDYHGDLNAIQAVFSKDDPDDCSYLEELCNVVNENPHDRVFLCPAVVNATAPQRCEAYLRTIGKWIE